MPTAVALLEMATATGACEAAAQLSESLEVAAHLIAGDSTLTVVARHLSAAMTLIGDRQRAWEYAQQGLELADKTQFRPERALLRLQLAELELDRGRQADGQPFSSKVVTAEYAHVAGRPSGASSIPPGNVLRTR